MEVEILRQLDRLQRQVDGLVKPELPPGLSLRALVSAYKSASTLNFTGDATLDTIVSDTEIFDRNGDYNNGTGVFTAPIDGFYLFTPRVLLFGLTVAHNYFYMKIQSSNRDYFGGQINIGAVMDSLGYYSFGMSQVVDMDATDTAVVQIIVSGGAKVVDVYGGASVQTGLGVYLII